MKQLLIVAAIFGLQTSTTLKLNDLDSLIGKKWTGTLTYLDYGTGKQESIETELTVTASGKGQGYYDWKTVYPKEPGHNSSDVVIISSDGKIFDGEAVKERTMRGDTSLIFVTTKEGTDNNKPALFKFTYTINPTTFTRRKEVCFKGEQQWFTRNTLKLKSK